MTPSIHIHEKQWSILATAQRGDTPISTEALALAHERILNSTLADREIRSVVLCLCLSHDIRTVDVLSHLLTNRTDLSPETYAMVRNSAEVLRARISQQEHLGNLHSPESFQEWLLDAPTESIWMLLNPTPPVESTVTPFELRCLALDELAAREDPKMPQYLVNELSNPTISPGFRNGLLLVADSIQVVDKDERTKFAKALFKHACDLYRDGKGAPKDGARATTPLWAAIWRFGTLRLQAKIGDLVKLFRQEDPPMHIDMVLLTIAHAFTAGPPTVAEEPNLLELRNRVTALAQASILPNNLETADGRAIALSSYCAAVLLLAPNLDVLTNQLAALRKRWIFSYVLGKLQDADKAWNTAAVPNALPYAKSILAQIIADLQVHAANS